MKSKSSFAGFIVIIIVAIGLIWAHYVYSATTITERVVIAAGFFIIALLISSSIEIAGPWYKAVVLRLGYFHSLKEPGLFFIVPVIDTILYRIDARIITTSFKAEKTLTEDTVPVDVLFWKVLKPQKTTLEVAGYLTAINWEDDIIGYAGSKR